MKICTKCKLEKSLSNFKIKNYKTNKLRSWCKSCDKIYNKEYFAKYYKENKDVIVKRITKNIKNRKQVDINFKLSMALRTRLWMAIKNNQKKGSAVNDLGCSILELKEHLEKQFQSGMSWDNWGKGNDKWNIDHIKPLSKFDLTDKQQFLEACNYKNLQPLWELDNIRKNCK